MMANLKLPLSVIGIWLCLFCIYRDYEKQRTNVDGASARPWCSEECFGGREKCYKLCNGVKTFRQAASLCVGHDATLLHIDKPGEKTYLTRLLQYEAPGVHRWHIGGKKRKGRWYWINVIERKRKECGDNLACLLKTKTKRKTARKPMFTGFIPNVRNLFRLPLETRQRRKCLTLAKVHGKRSLQFRTGLCRVRRGLNFICEMKQPVESLTQDTSGICGKRWHEPIGGIPNSGPTLKIYGGNAAHPREYPWQARLLEIDHRFGTELHLGGATIISEFWLLTAAHCVENYWKTNRLRVVVGDRIRSRWDMGEQIFDVSKVITHWGYDESNPEDYDIALVMVKPQRGRGIVFNRFVQPACLPNKSEPRFTPGMNCSISGWGVASAYNSYTGELRGATVPLLDHSICASKLNNYTVYHPRIICAGFPEVQGVDTTNGDSGGPLVCPINGVHTLVGITAFGREPYGQHPGVYSWVQAYVRWIRKTIKRNSPFMKQKKMPKMPEFPLFANRRREV